MTWNIQQNTRYDHRIKQVIAFTGDLTLFPELKIPTSTAKDWIKIGVPPIIELESYDYIVRL